MIHPRDTDNTPVDILNLVTFLYQVNQLPFLTCCCRCFAAACADVDVSGAALVVSMVTLADTSPLAATAAVGVDPPSGFEADWADWVE